MTDDVVSDLDSDISSEISSLIIFFYSQSIILTDSKEGQARLHLLWVSEWLLFNAKWAISQWDDDDAYFVLDQHV